MNRDEIREAIREILPKVSSVQMEALADLMDQDFPLGAERSGHLEMSREKFGYLSVGLDGHGNAVSVEFEEDGGWEVTF